MKGLYDKYEVRKRSDGTFVDNCFVLRPDRDDAAITALLAYANATSDEQLAQELREWVRFEQREKPRITNADRIRAMSDEELAILLGDGCPYNMEPGICGGLCANCWLEWLQQPYKEGEA